MLLRGNLISTFKLMSGTTIPSHTTFVGGHIERGVLDRNPNISIVKKIEENL